MGNCLRCFSSPPLQQTKLIHVGNVDDSLISMQMEATYSQAEKDAKNFNPFFPKSAYANQLVFSSLYFLYGYICTYTIRKGKSISVSSPHVRALQVPLGFAQPTLWS